MRWLIDEGMPKLLVDWLVARGDDVLDVAASPFKGSTDDALWKLAVDERRVVITRDVGFAPIRRAPPPPGLILVRGPDWYHADAILELIQTGLSCVHADSVYGVLTVIRPGRVRQRDLAEIMDTKFRK